MISSGDSKVLSQIEVLMDMSSSLLGVVLPRIIMPRVGHNKLQRHASLNAFACAKSCESNDDKRGTSPLRESRSATKHSLARHASFGVKDLRREKHACAHTETHTKRQLCLGCHPRRCAGFKIRVFLNLWFGKPMVCVRVAFHENDGNHENDENDKDNSDHYKQGVECRIRKEITETTKMTKTTGIQGANHKFPKRRV